MNGTWHNGRQATDAEAEVVRKGYDDAHERDLRLLAGLHAEQVPERFAGRLLDELPAIP